MYAYEGRKMSKTKVEVYLEKAGTQVHCEEE
jgi:hypothetical protein